MDLARPFDQGPRDSRQIRIENRLGDVEGLLVLPGGDEDRRGRLLGVVEHPHGVAETGRHVQVDDRELAGGLRVAVRHRHHGGLLERQHVTHLVVDRERIHQWQFGGAGIAEHHLDAFLLEQFEEGALSGHGRQSRNLRKRRGMAGRPGWALETRRKRAGQQSSRVIGAGGTYARR